MELEASVSDSKLHSEVSCVVEKDRRPNSAVDLSNIPVQPVQSNEQLKQFRHWVSNERWFELKKIAETAMRERKVFMIKGGGYHTIRRSLLDRGWVEKYESHKVRNPPHNVDPKKITGKELTKIERLILYKFMEHHSVDFLWTTKRDKYDWLLSNRDVIISRFCRSIFTTKEGLTASLTQMHWHTEPGLSYTRFPRCYNIHHSENLEEFIDDFRQTACISILKWLSKKIKGDGENIVSCTGKVPISAVDFAIARLEELLTFYSHLDIDENENSVQHVWEHEWDQFLTHHYLLVHQKAKFMDEKNLNLKQVEKRAIKTLVAVTKHWPQMDIDGVKNIWIVKPGNKCRGKGIALMNNIKDIINLVNIPNAQKTRYVVQKYIETPLVIYNTKFDIRQWFLVTCCQPLTIWVYRDSYLRFSSQIFSLSNYHESVHLTNNAVQHKYKNNSERDRALPDENMWDCHTFKAYLRSPKFVAPETSDGLCMFRRVEVEVAKGTMFGSQQIGMSEMWDTKIYPGMKECLVGAMLACQESMDKRINSFELYGADFMLSEDFTPWLIEINSSPDLAPTTSVTARLCPQCLEDVIKVVIDRKFNPEADTGTFELVYKQNIPKAPAYFGLTLCVNGKKVWKKHKDKRHELKNHATLSDDVVQEHSTSIGKDCPMPAEYSGPIITDFLSWLNPYGLKTDKHGIVEGNKESPPVRQTVNLVKSDISLKKCKSSTRSSRDRRSHKDRGGKRKSAKRCIVTHSCCKMDSGTDINQNTKILQNETSTNEKSKPEKSVGNKRCYIDPEEWSKETGNINRSTVSSVSKRYENHINRLTKSGNETSAKAPSEFTKANSKLPSGVKDVKDLSAIGTSILRKLNEENKSIVSNMYPPYLMTQFQSKALFEI